jgi:hypothetical protein
VLKRSALQHCLALFCFSRVPTLLKLKKRFVSKFMQHMIGPNCANLTLGIDMSVANMSLCRDPQVKAQAADISERFSQVSNSIES